VPGWARTYESQNSQKEMKMSSEPLGQKSWSRRKFLRGLALLAGTSAALPVLSACAPAAPAPTPAAQPTAPVAAKPTAAPTAGQPTAAPAQKVDFPQKGRAISIIVPYAAGGGMDLGVRLIAPALEAELGTPVQVVNKPGAGGQTGWTEAALAKPDGYTFTYSNLPATITTYLDPRRKAAYSRKSWLLLANHMQETFAVIVKGDGPYKTMKDLMDAAKAKPEQIKVGLPGIGSTGHIALLQLQKAFGVKFAPVQFDSGAAEATALMGGHTDLSISSYAAHQSGLKSGQTRCIAVLDSTESKFFPGVETAEAQGYKLYSAATRGPILPAGVPAEVADVLAKAFAKIIQNPEHIKKMEEMGLDVRYMDSATFSAYWDDQEQQLSKVMPELIAAG